jgi:hypothetical protein
MIRTAEGQRLAVPWTSPPAAGDRGGPALSRPRGWPRSARRYTNGWGWRPIAFSGGPTLCSRVPKIPKKFRRSVARFARSQ